jgi:hypothetical protein
MTNNNTNKSMYTTSTEIQITCAARILIRIETPWEVTRLLLLLHQNNNQMWTKNTKQNRNAMGGDSPINFAVLGRYHETDQGVRPYMMSSCKTNFDTMRTQEERHVWGSSRPRQGAFFGSVTMWYCGFQMWRNEGESEAPWHGRITLVSCSGDARVTNSRWNCIKRWGGVEY